MNLSPKILRNIKAEEVEKYVRSNSNQCCWCGSHPLVSQTSETYHGYELARCILKCSGCGDSSNWGTDIHDALAGWNTNN